MDKLDEFKSYIKDKPYLANKVKDGTFTWQTLYETYDMFGPEHEFFKDESKEVKSEEANDNEATEDTRSAGTSGTGDAINKFFKQLQKVDTKKISDGLENVKKIVGLIDEFRPNITSSSKLASSRIKPFRKYND